MSIPHIKKTPKPRNRVKKVKPKLTKEQRAEQARINGAKNKGNEAYPVAEPLVLPPATDEDLLADIYSPRANIPPEIKLAAVNAYMLTGTTRGAERLSGVSHQTISEWKNKSQWWTPVLAKVKKDKQEELDARITKILDKALGKFEERLELGDEVITKDGDRAHKQMGGRDVATSFAILYDKRAMLRGDPTSISAKADQKTLLEDLKSEFAAMAKEALDGTVVKDVTPKDEKA